MNMNIRQGNYEMHKMKTSPKCARAIDISSMVLPAKEDLQQLGNCEHGSWVFSMS